MVSGVLACKIKKERLKPLFFMPGTFHARQSAGVFENSRLHVLRAAFVLAASIEWGLNECERKRSPFGLLVVKAKWRQALMVSAYRRRPEVTRAIRMTAQTR
jgi:hypothetical protein